MMEKVGVKSLDDLYAEVPDEIRFRGDYQLPEQMSEVEVRQLFEKLGGQNEPLTCFGGAGVYDHYTPAVIPALLSRSEFLTSYTPYQAEISQGTLHYIFEYQSMMAELTGMDISNASMYDGTTAAAEAVMMAVAAGKKQDTVLISETVDPKTLRVIETYAHFHGIQIEMIRQQEGITDLPHLQSLLSLHQGKVAGVFVQQPNYYGIVEDHEQHCRRSRRSEDTRRMGGRHRCGRWAVVGYSHAVRRTVCRLYVLHGETHPQDARTYRRHDKGQPWTACFRIDTTGT